MAGLPPAQRRIAMKITRIRAPIPMTHSRWRARSLRSGPSCDFRPGMAPCAMWAWLKCQPTIRAPAATIIATPMADLAASLAHSKYITRRLGRELARPAPLQNRFDHLGFRVGVLLDVGPAPRGELALGGLVELTIGGVGTQAVPEPQMPVDLRATGREDVQVDVGVRALEQAMLVPVRLPDPQLVAGPFQVRVTGRCHSRWPVDVDGASSTLHCGQQPIDDKRTRAFRPNGATMA